MRLQGDRTDVLDETPKEVLDAVFVLGHYLAQIGAPDLKTNFNVTEDGTVIVYELEMREIKRYPWLIEGEVS